jgi:6-phosphogluconate dehydrogenase
VSSANQTVDVRTGTCDAGIIGLSAVSQNVGLNLADHQFQVATLSPKAGERPTPLRHAAQLPEFVALLRRPRTILLFSGGSHPIDSTINDLIPLLGRGDIIVDAGESYFKETAGRSRRLADRGLHFMALGIAGGAEAARHGAVVMPGGRREVHDRTFPLWSALAAKSDGRRCVSFLGSASAAHFVTMVHSGIDLGLMQLLSETLDLARRVREPSDVPAARQLGTLPAHLAEISGRSLHPTDETAGELEMAGRLESVKQSNLARWLTQTGRELEVPTPTIDSALGTQQFSARERQRELAATPYRKPVGRFGEKADGITAELQAALHAAMIITYAEGMALIATASERYGFHFNLGEIARVWKGGGSLRAPLLEEIATAIRLTPTLPNLLFDDDLAEKVMAGQESLRRMVWRATEMDVEVPALLASLDYLDFHREAWLPMNLIQVLRDDAGEAVESAPELAELEETLKWDLGER